MVLLKVRAAPGEEPQTFRIKDLPFTIGRAVDNQVTVDVPSLSAKHAVVERREDGLYIVDLASTNGIVMDGAAHTECRLAHRCRLHLGQVEIEILLEDATHEKTQVFSVLKGTPAKAAAAPPGGPARGPGIWEDIRISVPSLTVLAYALMFTTGYWLGATDMKAGATALTALGITAAFYAGAGVFSVLAKIVTREFRYFQCLRAVLAAAAVFELYAAVEGPFHFNLNLPTVSWWIEGAWLTLYWTWVYYLLSRILTETETRRKLVLISGAISIAVAIPLGIWMHIEEPAKFQADLHYPIRSFSPPPGSYEGVKADLDGLAKKVRKLREDKNKE